MIATLPKREEKTYAMLGGGTIRGASAASLVRALRASSYAPCDSEHAFMEEMSERCRFYSGATIGTYRCEGTPFLTHLVAPYFCAGRAGSGWHRGSVL